MKIAQLHGQDASSSALNLRLVCPQLAPGRPRGNANLPHAPWQAIHKPGTYCDEPALMPTRLNSGRCVSDQQLRNMSSRQLNLFL